MSLKLGRVLILIVSTFCLTTASSQSKDIVYLDEGYQKISKYEFDRKSNSKLYYALQYDLDTIIFKRVFLKYYMGHLDATDKNQLFALLKHRNGVDTSKTIFVHYKDTLPSIDSFPEKDSIVYFKNGKHRHIVSHKTFVNGHRNCEQSGSTKKIGIYHFFNFNAGHPIQIDKVKWHQDHHSLLRKLFYNKSDNNRNWTLLIHPNGDFVINNGASYSSKVWRDLKKHKNWDTHLKDFTRRFRSLNSYSGK
ncbi:hypothetical protein [Flagellimonas onchidii]|uniref:hypothetical protein n=1 Tax=Flagellimonas onchidii TaxID=2562684 RepID=UPI0010A67A90|nr:hypothetical protein [Allomuricauda onchidii]